jgi:hypothetical protein
LNKVALSGLFFLLIFCAVLAYTTLRVTRNRQRVEVCMEFRGKQACRTASGSSQDAAFHVAVQSACAELAKGLTDSRQCQASDPVRVNRLSE